MKEGSKVPDCIFCDIAQGRTGERVYEDDNCAAFRDINPQAPTHILIVPKAHVPTLNDLTGQPELVAALFAAAVKIAEQEGLKDDGYRIIANCGEKAGQSVWHVHLHLLGGRTMMWPPG